MYNSPESWAIHLRNLRAVWWSQCQVPCLHLRGFRPDLGQKMVDAIVSCLPKNAESTITILGYRHVNLGSTLLLTFWEWEVFLLGNDIHTKAQKRQKWQLQSPEATWWRIFPPGVVHMNLLVRKLADSHPWIAVLPFHIFSFVVGVPVDPTGKKIAFCKSSPLFFNSQNFHCFWARSWLYLF